VARRIFAGFDFRAPETAGHLWLRLPEPWRADSFVAQARRNGILLCSADDFAVTMHAAPQAVRVSLGPPENRAELERALTSLRELLHRSPEHHRSVV